MDRLPSPLYGQELAALRKAGSAVAVEVVGFSESPSAAPLDWSLTVEEVQRSSPWQQRKVH